MWITLLKYGNVDYHQHGNLPTVIIIIIITVVIVVVKNNINYY